MIIAYRKEIEIKSKQPKEKKQKLDDDNTDGAAADDGDVEEVSSGNLYCMGMIICTSYYQNNIYAIIRDNTKYATVVSIGNVHHTTPL